MKLVSFSIKLCMPQYKSMLCIVFQLKEGRNGGWKEGRRKWKRGKGEKHYWIILEEYVFSDCTMYFIPSTYGFMHPLMDCSETYLQKPSASLCFFKACLFILSSLFIFVSSKCFTWKFNWIKLTLKIFQSLMHWEKRWVWFCSSKMITHTVSLW